MKEYPTCQTCKYRKGSFCRQDATIIENSEWCSAYKNIKGNQNEETHRQVFMYNRVKTNNTKKGA